MLSPDDYNNLLPHREEIMKWKTTHKYRGEGLQLIDAIRQRMGYAPLCYTCDGNRIEAINDAIYLIEQYELENKINTANA